MTLRGITYVLSTSCHSLDSCPPFWLSVSGCSPHLTNRGRREGKEGDGNGFRKEVQVCAVSVECLEVQYSNTL